jgi:hypothetical protein
MTIKDDKVRTITFSLLLTTLLFSCNDRQTNKIQNEVTDPRTEKFGQIRNLWRTDTLTLYARFDECGEWGGHIEVFKLYSKSESPTTSSENLWFDYKRDSVDCSNPYENRSWTYSFTDKLTYDDQEKVIEYIHDLLNNSINTENLPRPSGQYYSVFTGDSTLIISNYGPPIVGFQKLKTQLVK